MAQITIIERNGNRRACDFSDGDTILSVARRDKVDIEGACEGAMACSTCHVVVAPEWAVHLPKPGLEENAMLDIASNVTRYSRLGCQIKLTPELDGLTVKIA